VGIGGDKEVPRVQMVKALKRTVFVGTFRHSVDEKNRVAIPAKWRAAASGAQEFYVLQHPKEHLYVLTETAMDKMIDKADEIGIGEYEKNDTLRLLGGNAHGTPCDKQGRITLTEDLLRHAGITGEAVLVGVLRGFEIWSPARLEAVTNNTAANFTESTRQLGI